MANLNGHEDEGGPDLVDLENKLLILVRERLE